jgi:DNA-directed RNA polymerase subunit beta
VIGRAKAYEAIIKGEEIQKPQVPASFAVLVRELQSLMLNVEVIEDQAQMDKIEAGRSLLETESISLDTPDDIIEKEIPAEKTGKKEIKKEAAEVETEPEAVIEEAK